MSPLMTFWPTYGKTFMHIRAIDRSTTEEVKATVADICAKFPMYV